MKKILILLVTMMLCACSPAEPMSLKDSYGQYKQEKIVYANKKVELSNDEKEKVPEARIKYNLYEGEKQLGIAVYLGEETVYIASYDQYDGSPVYIAKMKKIINKS